MCARHRRVNHCLIEAGGTKAGRIDRLLRSYGNRPLPSRNTASLRARFICNHLFGGRRIMADVKCGHACDGLSFI